MFCTDISAPSYLIFSNSVPQLLYYSHIPTAIIALFLGFFVFYKSRGLVSKILVYFTLIFSMWIFFNLIIWTNVDSRLIMFFWTLLGLLDPLLFALGFYFTYVFINKKDIRFELKLVLSLVILPAVLFVSRNTTGVFYLPNCEPVQGGIYDYYIFGLELFFILLTIVTSVISYRKAAIEEKMQIIYVSIGILLFFSSFFVAGLLSSYLDDMGFEFAFEIEQYGLFGMTVFMGFLAYLIVKYEAFHMKILAAQALVAALIILVGSELFFANNTTNQTLILITLAISIGFGYMLIKSIKLEVERKEQLQNMADKLATANDQLRKLDNAKSEFISIASHQLRTPLTAIKGFVSMMLEGSYGAITVPQKDVLNKVYLSNERLINLVEDLLNLSRIESGRMEYKFEKVNLEEVCLDIYDTFALKAREKSLRFELKRPTEYIPEVSTDKNKVVEVISNLVDNALKYTPRGWVSMRLTPNGKFVRCSVVDTGIGVPPEEIPYLFQKFSRGKDVSRLNASGTGIGLHVGKRMIESMGGTIGIESDGANRGSIFFIDIPIEYDGENVG